MTDRYNGIDTPDDVPEPYVECDPDTLPERPTYLNEPMTREQIDAAIAKLPTPQLGVRQAS